MKMASKYILIASVLLGIYSCAKKDSNNTPSTPAPVITNFSVNGVAAISPIPGATKSGGSYVVSATDGTYGYPQVKITFPDTIAPASGPYSIINGGPSGYRCSFLLIPDVSGNLATASSGVVTVSAAPTPNNTASFSNIVCRSTATVSVTYTVSGTIKY
jgi:hypothetical protein